MRLEFEKALLEDPCPLDEKMPPGPKRRRPINVPSQCCARCDKVFDADLHGGICPICNTSLEPIMCRDCGRDRPPAKPRMRRCRPCYLVRLRELRRPENLRRPDGRVKCSACGRLRLPRHRTQGRTCEPCYRVRERRLERERYWRKKRMAAQSAG